MRIEQMKYLLEVAACGSISAAAKKLYVNQTTLSAAIQAMEGELGEKLFRRTPKGVVLTPFGEAALPKLQDISDKYDELLHLDNSHSTIPQQVDVCIYACACHFWSLYLTKALRQAELNTLVTIHESSGNHVLSYVLSGKATIGIGGCSPHGLDALTVQAEKNGFVLEPLYQETPHAFVSLDSPLAKRGSLTSKDLENEHLATNICCLERFYTGQFAQTISHVSVFSNIETTKDAVRHNNMVCILPPIAMEAQPTDGLKLLPLADTASETFLTYLVHPHAKDMNPAERTVADSVKRWCAENRHDSGSGK